MSYNTPLYLISILQYNLDLFYFDLKPQATSLVTNGPQSVFLDSTPE